MQELIIPLETPSLNKWYSGGHWSKRKDLADLWHLIVKQEVKKQGIKSPVIYPIRITTMTHYKGKGRVKDTSNTFPANKLVEDGLVKAGILPDDTVEYVADHLVLRPAFNTGENKVIVWIEELEEIRKKRRAGAFCDACHKEL